MTDDAPHLRSRSQGADVGFPMNLTRALRSPRLVSAALVIGTGLVAALLGWSPFAAGADPHPVTPHRPDSALADGRHLVSIGGAWVSPPELSFDEVELFVGDEAVAAATADGVDPDEVGDYYIRDREHRSEALPVSLDVAVRVVDCTGSGCVEGSPIGYDEFTVDRDENGHFWITVDGGVVVRIEQMYLP